MTDMATKHALAQLVPQLQANPTAGRSTGSHGSCASAGVHSLVRQHSTPLPAITWRVCASVR